jgi:hypothetical protein
VPRHPGRAPRGQVGLARKVQVERLKPTGGLQQQWRSTAAQPRRERHVGPQQLGPGMLELVKRPGLRLVQQFQHLAERARLHLVSVGPGGVLDQEGALLLRGGLTCSSAAAGCVAAGEWVQMRR